MTTPTPEQVKELVERLRAIDRSGGPDPPWEAVGSTSIRTPGRDMFLLTESNDFTNPWTRQKICDAINLVGEAASTLTALLAALQESERETAACICKGNWRSIVAKYEPLIGRHFKDHRGLEYTFGGIVHSDDDYYYLLTQPGDWTDRRVVLSSCVGSLEGSGYTLIDAAIAKEQKP